MARYQSKYLATSFPEVVIVSASRVETYKYSQDMKYTPPTLPAHVSIRLEPVIGVPSEAEVIKVQDAIRSYQQFSNARYSQRARQRHASSIPHEIPRTGLTGTVERVTDVTEESSPGTNNIGTGADIIDSGRPAQATKDVGIRDAIERSNRLAQQANQLAERANLLLERSNQIAERSNQLVEQSRQPVDQSNQSAERFSQLFGRLNKHLEQSNHIARGSTEPVEKLGEVLGNINRVLVRIQHAIVRNHKGNTISALDCLVNEKGETPAIGRATGTYTFGDILKSTGPEFSVVIDGVARNSALANSWLGKFLYFYGIGSGLCESLSSAQLMEGKENAARERLSDYLSSCLG
ncbi:hypothetical protein FRC11_011495 [Ceratobasidium sp. 423]|nr:hypothetical protein FRC11_011495 [Ceratobasidium sp. 423]